MTRTLRKTWLIGLLLLTGCATVNKPAFNKDTASIDISEESVVLLSVNMKNSHKPRYQPNSSIIFEVQRPGAKDKSERFNLIVPKEDFEVLPDGSTEALVRATLRPGDWEIVEMSGTTTYFPVIGNFLLPLDSSITVPAQSVVYLGRLEARIRKREDGEFRAGGALPLIDQAVSGYSNGTFDVTVVNDLDRITSDLKSEYPALASQQIQFLPGFTWNREPLDAKMNGK